MTDADLQMIRELAGRIKMAGAEPLPGEDPIDVVAVITALVDEVVRLRTGFHRAIASLRIGGSVRHGACNWCDAAWVQDETHDKPTVIEQAKAHATVCPGNPFRQERDALRLTVEQLTAQRDRLIAHVGGEP